MNDILTIDGINYQVNIVSLKQTSEFLDKYSERTEDWDLARELAGILFNYELVLGEIQNASVATSLHNKLHEFVSFHEVRLPHNDTFLTFQAYIKGVSRELLDRKTPNNRWGGYKITFVAKTPQVTS